MRTFALLLASTTFITADAQPTGPEQHHRTTFTTAAHAVQRPVAGRDDAPPLWSEDFEQGLGAWVVETTEGPVSWALTSNGNANGYTPGPLESTTGFPTGSWIVADSDAQGTSGAEENTTITSPPILGMDDQPHLLLRFEQSFRQLNDDQTLVEVSGDGGANWTVFPVNTNIPGNQSTPGAPLAQTITLNISTALTQGSSDIRIRFRWISSEGYTYSWQVDDLALVPALPDDLVLEQATWAEWHWDGVHFEGMPCTIYQTGEVRPLRFMGVARNNGINEQTEVRLQVNVSGPNGYTALLTSGTISLGPGMVDTLRITGYTPPTATGDLALSIRVLAAQSDDAPEDNVVQHSIRIDPHVYARDEGPMLTQRDNAGEDFELGNRFWIQEYGKSLYAVQVALGPGTDPGAVIAATVYDEDFNYVAESEFHTVVAAEINPMGGEHFITLRLTDPLALQGERVYLACVYGIADDGDVWIGSSGTSPAQSSFIYKHNVNQWYYVTNTPMVRMNFDPDVHVDERPTPSATALARPSPFTGSTEIELPHRPEGRITWRMTDAAGRVVRSGPVASGERTFQIAGEDLPAGVYTIRMEGSTAIRPLRVVKAGH